MPGLRTGRTVGSPNIELPFFPEEQEKFYIK